MNIRGLYLHIAVIVFSFVMVSLPWESWQGYKFVDLNVYKKYFLYGAPVYEYINISGLVDFITREALWHYSGMFLIRTLGIPADYVFSGISVICFYTFSYFLAKQKGLLSLVFLINPLFVTLAMSQLRSALAFSLLLIAFMLRRNIIKILLAILPLFLHTSTILFLFIYFSTRFLLKKTDVMPNKFRMLLALCFIGIVISMSVGSFRQIILSYLGDRRADYGDASSSFLFTSYWIFLLILTFFQSNSFLKDEINCWSVIVLSLVTANLFTGGYSLRFLALFLPIIVSTMLSFNRQTKTVNNAAYLFYTSLQWFYWVQVKIV